MPDESWIEIGGVDEIPRQGARRVKRSGKPFPVAVFRTADDQVFALVNQCPHRGAPLSEGYVNGCTVACPLHGFIVDLESGNVLPPDEGRAPRISTQVIDGRVFLAAWAVSAPGGWE